MEYFERLQQNQNIIPAVKIPLHSNVRWGTAHKMLQRALDLEMVRNVYSPISV